MSHWSPEVLASCIYINKSYLRNWRPISSLGPACSWRPTFSAPKMADFSFADSCNEFSRGPTTSLITSCWILETTKHTKPFETWIRIGERDPNLATLAAVAFRSSSLAASRACASPATTYHFTEVYIYTYFIYIYIHTYIYIYIYIMVLKKTRLQSTHQNWY